MTHALLLFPHQLFEGLPEDTSGMPVILAEEYLLFRQYQFCTQKIILHRASMRAYASALEESGRTVVYLESTDLPTTDALFGALERLGVRHLHVIDPTDDYLEAAARAFGARAHHSLTMHETPMFLTPRSVGEEYIRSLRAPRMHYFYEWQRKRLGLLVNETGKPLGGAWSFDTDNRKRWPKKTPLPPSQAPCTNEYIVEAQRYGERYFPRAYGSYEMCFYVVTHNEAREVLRHFIEHSLAGFGPYEDAMVFSDSTLYHSVLTPYLNIGLLTPHDVVDACLRHAAAHDVPIQSLEGFIRQIIGWREYIRLMYHVHGRKMRTRNFWQHTKDVPKTFWAARTGILPVDTVIDKVLRTGYCHHIERLMVLGNWMLLSRYAPDAVYRWFMELFVDSYDWVMVPNVYAMSQFADGGILATKPYISSSNYLRKMSSFPVGEWCAAWDELFWCFSLDHKKFFEQLPRMRMLIHAHESRTKKK